MAIRLKRFSHQSKTQRRKYVYRILTLFVAAGMSFAGNSVFAQQWILGADGKWNTAANWDGGVVPNSPIAEVTSSLLDTITLDSSVEILSLTLDGGGAINHTSGTLKIASGGFIDTSGGVYHLNGGTISGGSIRASSSVNLYKGTLNNVAFDRNYTLIPTAVTSGDTLTITGGTTIAGDLELDFAAPTLVIDQDLTYNWTLNVGANTGLVVNGGSTLTIGSNVSLNGDNSFLTTNGTIENNGGLYTAGSPSALSGSGTFKNNSSVTAVVGALNVSVAFNNQLGATLSAESGSKVNMNGAWSNAGTISVTGGSTLELAGTTVNPIDGGISLSSTSTLNINQDLGTKSSLTITDSTVTVGAGKSLTISSAGSMSLSNGTLESTGSTINEGTVTSSGFSSVSTVDLGTFTNNGTLEITDGTLTVNGSVINNDIVNIGMGATLEVASGTTTFANSSTLKGQGTLTNWSGNVIELNGAVNPGADEIGTLILYGANGTNVDFQLGNNAVTNIQIGDGGTDLIDATSSNFKLGGSLVVSLFPGYEITGLNEWTIITRSTNDNSFFNGLAQDGWVGTFGGYDLLVDYYANGGTDVRLYSQVSAVPEPSSFVLMGLASVAVAGYRTVRRRSKKKQDAIAPMDVTADSADA